MRVIQTLLFPFFILILFSCNRSVYDEASDWTKEIKAKILEDSGIYPDSTQRVDFSSEIEIVSTFNSGRLLKTIRLNSTSKDTLSTLNFSFDQNFVLGRELCPLLKDQYVEVVLFKGRTLGEHLFYYCNGSIKKKGLNVGGKVGLWKEYDMEGNLTGETDYGNLGKLDSLKVIKYNR